MEKDVLHGGLLIVVLLIGVLGFVSFYSNVGDIVGMAIGRSTDIRMDSIADISDSRDPRALVDSDDDEPAGGGVLDDVEDPYDLEEERAAMAATDSDGDGFSDYIEQYVTDTSSTSANDFGDYETLMFDVDDDWSTVSSISDGSASIDHFENSAGDIGYVDDGNIYVLSDTGGRRTISAGDYVSFEANGEIVVDSIYGYDGSFDPKNYVRFDYEDITGSTWDHEWAVLKMRVKIPDSTVGDGTLFVLENPSCDDLVGVTYDESDGVYRLRLGADYGEGMAYAEVGPVTVSMWQTITVAYNSERLAFIVDDEMGEEVAFLPYDLEDRDSGTSIHLGAETCESDSEALNIGGARVSPSFEGYIDYVYVWGS